jgi:putative SOS response-associated peptidase YedK
MCGRFTNRYSRRDLMELYGLTTPYFRSNFPPRYNIAPTQTSFVLRLDSAGKRQLTEMKWGLVPSWSNDGKMARDAFNAKSETVAEKPTYCSAFDTRPCLVVADGFYEWKKLGSREKQPYFVTRAARRPFAFAGLWDSWRPKVTSNDAIGLETFTILTCAPNVLCAQIQDRMPVMLAPEDWGRWLGTREQRMSLLRPFSATDMMMWPVISSVGNVKNNGPELCEPILHSARRGLL